MSTFTVSSERLKEIAGNFKSAKIMVIGDIMIDEYTYIEKSKDINDCEDRYREVSEPKATIKPIHTE